jgi:hypothetical protein
MITDELIKEKLPRKEARELLSLNRKHGIPGIPFILADKRVDGYFQNLRETYSTLPKGCYAEKRTSDMIRCLDLYEKVSGDHKEIMLHWHIAWQTQQEVKKSYKSMSKPPRQDNKSYVNYGSGNSNRNKIRYPKKKRKTAWKRFYKLFPHLKPDDES